VVNRAVRQKSFNASCESGKDTPKPFECILAGPLCRQLARSGRQRSIDGIVHHQPAVDHVRKTVAQPRLTKLGK
jgi:hypothetical protein